MKLSVLDLFSGIGGFSLGLERTGGFETVAFCEIEEFPRKVLARHWPDVLCFNDVRELGAEHVGPVDVICGGFPCQDISTAGLGAGLDGARSGLWSEIARLVGELRPKFLILENVAALLSRGLDRVLGDLAKIGYDAEWHCIPAFAVGAPHRRDRIWIVAYPSGFGQPRSRESIVASYCEALGKGEAIDALTSRFGDFWATEPRLGGGIDGVPSWMDRHIGRGLSLAESKRRSEVLRGVWSPHVSQALRRSAGGLERVQQAQVLFSFVREYEKNSDEARLLVEGKEASEELLRSLRERSIVRGASHKSGQNRQRKRKHTDTVQPVSRLLACDREEKWSGSGWEDSVPRVDNGIPNRMDRLKSLGNAVVPQIPEFIGMSILWWINEHIPNR